jgi:hypothetical protein
MSEVTSESGKAQAIMGEGTVPSGKPQEENWFQAYRQMGEGTVPSVKPQEESWFRAYPRNLFKASLEKPIEFLALIVAAVAAAFVIWQLLVATSQLEATIGQLRAATDALESQAESYIVTGLAELDKLNLEHPELRRYFNQNADFSTADAGSLERAKILALADAQLDFFDSYYTQQDNINWSRHTKEGWENYFEHSFKCSPALRYLFCADYNQYGHSIHKFAEERLHGLCNGKLVADPLPWTPEECHE